MLLFILLLILASGYAVRYAVHCFTMERRGAGVGALLLSVLPLLAVAALIAVMASRM